MGGEISGMGGEISGMGGEISGMGGEISADLRSYRQLRQTGFLSL